MDRQAFVDEMTAARPQAMAAAYRVTKNLHDAEDAVATAIEQAWLATAKGTLKSPAAWLTHVSRLRALDRLRRGNRETLDLPADQHPWYVDEGIEGVLDCAEAHWFTLEAQKLPEMTGAVLATIVAGASPKEAAAALGLTTRAVESHLRRARLRLRATWTSTLAVLGLWARSFRRLAVSASVVPAAVVLMMLPQWGQHDPAVSVGPRLTPTLSKQASAGLMSHELPAGMQQLGHVAQGSMVRPTVKIRHQGAVGRDQTYAKVSTPNGGQVRVHEDDRGGPSGPVDGTLACLQNFEVKPSHIGC